MLCSFSCPLLLYHWIAHLILGSFLLVVVEAVAPEVIPAAEDGLHLAPALALRSPLSLGHAHRAPVLTAAPVPTRDPGLQQHTHTHTHTHKGNFVLGMSCQYGNEHLFTKRGTSSFHC